MFTCLRLVIILKNTVSISINLWALYDSLSSNCKVILMGDFNGDLGNSLGDKGKREPNERGLKLLSFANVFNLSPTC